MFSAIAAICFFEVVSDLGQGDGALAQADERLMHDAGEPVRAAWAGQASAGQQLIGQLRANQRRRARFPVVSVTGHRCSVSHRVSFREPPFLRLIVRPRHLHSR
jgi:hypothetical protein